MALRIINIKGTSDYKRSDSWIELWRQATGREPTRCYETNCFRRSATFGFPRKNRKRKTLRRPRTQEYRGRHKGRRKSVR